MFLATLQKTNVLWVALVATVAIAAGFGIWSPSVGGVVLDSLRTTDEAIALLNGMTEQQKSSHFIMTATLDMLFPAAYGALFAGLTLRFGGSWGKWLAIVAYVTVVADYLENILQLVALTGTLDVLDAKSVLTEVKLTTFPAAALLALATFLLYWIRRFLTRNDE